MRRLFAIFGSALFLVVAPGTVAGLVPWWLSHGRMQPPFLNFVPFRVAGALLVVAGLPGLLDSFARFALKGLGTPAPVFPTRHLVVTGFYRHVRNPMYISVVSIILGQALLLGNVRILEYGLAVWVLFHLFVLFYEEPKLRSTFGAEYEAFCRHVPRWIPQLTAWRSDPQQL